MMKNTFGNNVAVTLFGESHGEAIGAVIDGLMPGETVDPGRIGAFLYRRRGVDALSTARREPDEFRILSGVFEGKTTGTPLCIMIPNRNVRSDDYRENRTLARPGHADYTAQCKYEGFQDYRGGGHFSGRITAALVAAGAVITGILEKRGIQIFTHLRSIGDIRDRDFNMSDLSGDRSILENSEIPVLDSEAKEKIKALIAAAGRDGDSVGGILETVITGVPCGVGEPWFDSVESLLSHMLFSIPGIKGVEFGDGFGLTYMRGSEANDPFFCKDGHIFTQTNHNGGINGGITNGMPIVFRCAVKPTPSIYKTQQTVDLKSGRNCELNIKGRHDPCIAHRACPVVDSAAAAVICDMLSGRYGTSCRTRYEGENT